jgi:hypothetical protein
MSAAPATAPAQARRPPRPTPRPKPKSASRPAPRGRKAPLRAVRPAAKHRRRTTPFLLLSALVVGSLVVGIVTLQALVSQTSFRMQDLQARNHALQQDYGERRLTVARLSAPDRIAAAAGRAGFVLPDSSHIATLHVGTGRGGGPAGRRPVADPGSSELKALLGAQP